MKYTRSQINKAGEIIMQGKNLEEYEAAMQKINDWRSLHLAALDELENSLIPMFNKNEIHISFLSRRLKRIDSIQYKLDLNPDMRLGGMQDIGGLRIVVPDITTLDKAKALLTNEIPEKFSLQKQPMDYVQNPKASGYRSIHFIYKYSSTDKDVDGSIIELQIRTKLQHCWAMAVETAGLVTNTSLKSSMGSATWLDFFKITSSLFAIKENRPILQAHEDNKYDMFTLMEMLYKTNTEHKFSDTLKALKISSNHAKEENFTNGYYLLNINFDTKRVHIDVFSKSEEQKATSCYTELEKCTRELNNSVVLVSVPKMKELQDAYPSYFLNTTEFIAAVDKMIDNYKRLLTLRK